MANRSLVSGQLPPEFSMANPHAEREQEEAEIHCEAARLPIWVQGERRNLSRIKSSFNDSPEP